MTAEERALVRATARQSCLVQGAEPSVPAPVAKPASAEDPKGLFKTLLKGSTQRSPGHERLRRRGRY